MKTVIEPGSTLGVLGSGQLGRMFAIAARRLGYRVHVFSPDDDTPTGQVADLEIRADYLDLSAVERFARGVDVVTFEFENVPAATTAVAERFTPVRPAGSVLQITQQRLREKQFLSEHGFPVTRFAAAHSSAEVTSLMQRWQGPAVLKTASWGYDGKGQAKLAGADDVAAAWQTIFPPGTTGETTAVLEAFVPFEAELSVVGARDGHGNVALYGPMLNVHRHHILDISSTPAALPERVRLRALELTRSILEQLDVVGVLCAELFLTSDHELLVNELAPRPHNSGHLTIDAHVTCQFEQQVRAVCGLPLGSAELIRPAAMVNLLGDLWQAGPPKWSEALAVSDVKLHLYGKWSPRPGRKMGHLTALAPTAEEAIARAVEARRLLSGCMIES